MGLGVPWFGIWFGSCGATALLSNTSGLLSCACLCQYTLCCMCAKSKAAATCLHPFLHPTSTYSLTYSLICSVAHTPTPIAHPISVVQVALKLPKAPPCHQEVLIMEVTSSSVHTLPATGLSFPLARDGEGSALYTLLCTLHTHSPVQSTTTVDPPCLHSWRAAMLCCAGCTGLCCATSRGRQTSGHSKSIIQSSSRTEQGFFGISYSPWIGISYSP